MIVTFFLATISLVSGQTLRSQSEDGARQVIQTYDPPNEQQVKTDITSRHYDRANGRIVYQDAKINQYPVTGGAPDMTAEAPECSSDYQFNEFTSTNRLKAIAGKGNFSLEGIGFLFLRAENNLIVSNQVHSLLKLRAATNSTPAPVTEISSHRGEFQMKTDATNGMALYLGSVRVRDAQMNLSCEWLKADLPKNEANQTNRPSHIVARTNVVMDFASANGEKIHALGEQAIYDYRVANAATNETLELTGNPRVNLTNGWMTADVFTLDRATGKLRGRGNFHFHYQPPGQVSETEIAADHFDFDMNTRLANFYEHVRAHDPRLQLAAEFVTSTLPKQEAGNSNKVDHILALTNVVLDFPIGAATNHQIAHATGQKAVYDSKVVAGVTNEIMELTGNPLVQVDKGWMSADLVKMDRAQGRIWGTGNHHSVIKKMPGELATMDTEIFSDTFEYTMTNGLALYRKNVRAYDPEMNLLQANVLRVKVAQGAKGATNVQSMTAQGNVVLEFAEKAFDKGDITNLPAFAASLKKSDGVPHYMQSQLSPATKKLLAGYSGGTNEPLRQALAADLNHLAQSGAIYDPARFTNTFLSVETEQLMKQHPMGLDVVELNRLLLVDAFRGALARGRVGEKTHATCDAAVYGSSELNPDYGTILSLTGHPKVYNPSGWMEADDSIIYNRTTGVCHYYGHPAWHPNLQGLVKTSKEKK